MAQFNAIQVVHLIRKLLNAYVMHILCPTLWNPRLSLWWINVIYACSKRILELSWHDCLVDAYGTVKLLGDRHISSSLLFITDLNVTARLLVGNSPSYYPL